MAIPRSARDVQVEKPWTFDHTSQAQFHYLQIAGYSRRVTRKALAFARLLRVASGELTIGADPEPLGPRLAACLLAGSADDAIELTEDLLAVGERAMEQLANGHA